MDFEVVPSIDLRSGSCVRLRQGHFHQETVYSADPLQVALRWQEAGAPRLHIVDLDGAATGRPQNLAVVQKIAARLDIPIQLGGGIRDMATAAQVLSLGVQRLVLGTMAVKDPSFVAQACRRFGSKAVVVTLDARGGKVAIRGWQERTALGALELMRRMAELGVEQFIYTDIQRDGTLEGPDLEQIAHLVSRIPFPLWVSGGIASLEHLKALKRLGARGAIVGRALYSGALNLKEALAAFPKEGGEGDAPEI